MSQLDLCQCGHIAAAHEPVNDLIGNGHLPCLTCSCGGFKQMTEDVKGNEEIWNLNSTHFLHYHDKEGITTEGRGIFKPAFDRIMDAKDAAHAIQIASLEKELAEAKKDVVRIKSAYELGSDRASVQYKVERDTALSKLKIADEALLYYAEFFEGKSGSFRRIDMGVHREFFITNLPQIAEQALQTIRGEEKG